MASKDGKCMFHDIIKCDREKCGDCSVWKEENHDPLEDDPYYYGEEE